MSRNSNANSCDEKIRNVVLLGSTGSIGESTVKVVRQLPERLRLFAVAAGKNVKRLAEQAREFSCKYACIADETKYEELKKLLPSSCTALAGEEGLIKISTDAEADTVLCAIVGTGGLVPAMEALKHDKVLALASKEVLVMAGSMVMKAAAEHGNRIIPVDSEHSAIFQCLEGRDPDSVRSIILTASGGPFRKHTFEQLSAVRWDDAMKHPTWSMGPKVTLDSASLMNKALEMIEARWLFGVEEKNIEVVIHPQSIVHSMVRFKDGGIIAQLSRPDMRFPIQYALLNCDRATTDLPELDFASADALTFEKPNEEVFPSLAFARHALSCGIPVMPAVLNAANEEAFDKFRSGAIPFTGIWKIVGKTMEKYDGPAGNTLEEIIEGDALARRIAKNLEV